MYTKYPSTPHLRGSNSIAKDDTTTSDEIFEGKYVVITEKMDGENTTMYGDHIHARSVDSRHHPSRDWVKRFHASIRHNIPEGWRVCGENVYAEHSIHYDSLPSYFLGFSIWNEDNICLRWIETLTLFQEWGITPVPILWCGLYDPKIIEAVIDQLDTSKQEGFVVRSTNNFHFSEFQNNVAKYVRKDHVQTDQHWTKKSVVPNQLA